ncbi:ankyrin repeat protein, partial [Elysia marginata]
SGWTPLHYAIRGKHLKVVEWLLYAGADVNIKNKDEESPLDVTEEDSLMRKMLMAFNVDRDIFPCVHKPSTR